MEPPRLLALLEEESGQQCCPRATSTTVTPGEPQDSWHRRQGDVWKLRALASGQHGATAGAASLDGRRGAVVPGEPQGGWHHGRKRPCLDLTWILHPDALPSLKITQTLSYSRVSEISLC